MIKALGYVMLVVQNMQVSVDFYNKLLNKNPEVFTPRWSQYKIGNIIIGLHSAHSWSDNNDPLIPYQSGQKGVSFGFWVDNLDEFINILKDKSITTINYGPRITGIGNLIYITDPDGHFIQVCQPLK